MAVIGYHVNDNYTNIYADARVAYYNMVGYPHILVDGSQLFQYTYEDIFASYEERIAENTNYSISMEVSKYGTLVDANINVGFIGAPNPETKVLHLVLTESHIQESWYGGEEVNHAARLMIPDENGTSILSDSFDFNFEMDPIWVAQNCELLAFVQDSITKEIMQAQVFLLEETVLYNDVVLNRIISPGDDYCLNQISPEIEIVNYGADTLINCVISYTINNETYEYNWEGNLSTYQMEQVILPEVNIFLEEGNNIEIMLSLPNGQIDEYPDNNILGHSFGISEIISQLPLQFEIRTDDFGSETSWELLNSDNDIIHSGSGYESNTLYTFEWDLSLENCYRFIIYDSAANGICCESGLGFYKIKDNTGETIFFGGNFEDHETKMFQVEIETRITTENVNSEVSIFPNPVNDFLSVETDKAFLGFVIYGPHGNIVYEHPKPLIRNSRINLSNLQRGIYFVRIETKNAYTFQKIIKN